TTFANLALDLFAANVFGQMVAVREGRYAHAPLPDPSLGPRTVDVDKLYNTRRYRPLYAGKLGDPLFLISA
ncbi:MAG: 6-phosphofructokinase, partial [Candidatus Acidiferrales bacterium]